jgi:prepilin-type N-terminal cleavage/methylation domain-containing protein
MGVCRMKVFARNHNAGLTLIEVMVVILIIAVAVIGAMRFRYYCVVDAKRADVQINAARVGAMLLETWKGMGGLSNYNPSAEFPLSTYGSQFEIRTSTSGLAAPAGFSPLATSYSVLDKANNVYYYVTLSSKPAVPPEPKALHATVVWRRDYTAGSVTSNDHTTNLTAYMN